VFTEPQPVVVATVTTQLPKVDGGNRSSLYESTAAGLALKIRHLLGKRIRREIRLDITKTAPDPLLDGVSRQYSMTAGLWIDVPPLGFSNTEQVNNALALVDWAKVAGNLTKVVNGES
jgi:hypothetical protein